MEKNGCDHLQHILIEKVDNQMCKYPDSNQRSTLKRRRSYRDAKWSCASCGASEQPWICLSCGVVNCSRDENKDALRHFELNRGHCVVMNCNDTSVFCYKCDEFIADDTSDFKINSVRQSLREIKNSEDALLRELDDNSSSESYDSPEIIEQQGGVAYDQNLERNNENNGLVVKRIPLVMLDPVSTVVPDEGEIDISRRGLQNLGNTCFMNSVLQALVSVDCFTNFMLSLPPIIQKDGPDNSEISEKRSYHTRSSLFEQDEEIYGPPIFTEILRRTVQELMNGKQIAYSPNAFFREVWRLNHRFHGYQQQDSHEFLRIMLDRMHVDLQKCDIPDEIKFSHEYGNKNWGASETMVTRIFEGSLLSQLTCLTCNSISAIQDPFLDLSLELPIPSLRSCKIQLVDCIANFFINETLEEGEQHVCEKCGTKQPSTKQFFLQSLPNVFCIHLKRFQWALRRGKLDFAVDFPFENLDMAPYLAANTEYSGPQLYELCSIIVHHGSGVSSGHYTAYGRSGSSWLLFNDERVRISSAASVAAQRAYILFYKKSLM